MKKSRILSSGMQRITLRFNTLLYVETVTRSLATTCVTVFVLGGYIEVDFDMDTKHWWHICGRQ